MNTEHSRLPRLKNRRQLTAGKVALVPHAVKGPAVHPPKTEKILKEKINRKEKNLALRSAIAATANPEIVKTRGHITSGKTLPIVADDSLESVKKTKDVEKFLIAVGLEADVSRSEETRSRRSGVRELRKGGYRERKSVLIVYGKDGDIGKAARNIPGVDCADVEKLNADLLAPGGVAVIQVITIATERYTGYRARPGQAPAFGLSIEEVEPVGFGSLKKGDKVVVITGKDKGKEGKILKIFPDVLTTPPVGTPFTAYNTDPVPDAKMCMAGLSTPGWSASAFLSGWTMMMGFGASVPTYMSPSVLKFIAKIALPAPPSEEVVRLK